MGDQEAIKLFSMRGIPQVFDLVKTHVIDYSCLVYIFTFIAYVKMSIARGQYAWVKNKFYFTHQRLNKEYLNNNNTNNNNSNNNNSNNNKNNKKKSVFRRIWIGLKLGWNTPTLPDNIIKLQLHPLIRILRVLGGISTVLILTKKSLLFPSFFLYLFLILSLIFFIYHTIISIIRIKYMYKTLKSDKFNVRNSPLDRLASIAGKTLWCIKGSCDQLPNIGIGLSLGAVIDQILENSGRDPVFMPFLGSMLNKIIGGETAGSIYNKRKQAYKELSTLDKKEKLLEQDKKSLESLVKSKFLSEQDKKILIEEFLSSKKEIKNNRNKILDTISQELEKKDPFGTKKNKLCLVKIKNMSNTKKNNYNKLNKNTKIWFEQWLVGITDGDGTFSIVYQNNKWNLAYKIALSRYNLRALFYIKKQLGFGSVTKDNRKGQFFIRDRKIIERIIIPIFDKYPLLTSKQFNYIKFKQALYILNDTNLTKNEKQEKLSVLKNKLIPENYISPIWNDINLSIKPVSNVINIMTKPWLVGFIEAEGSFYLVSKDSTRIVHGFGLTQKLDKIVLESIKVILGIPTSVKYKEKHKYYILDTTNSRAIENIINYFYNTMKGMKSVEYRIWARSYNKHKKDYNKLSNIRNTLRMLKIKLLEVSLFDNY